MSTGPYAPGKTPTSVDAVPSSPADYELNMHAIATMVATAGNTLLGLVLDASDTYVTWGDCRSIAAPQDPAGNAIVADALAAADFSSPHRFTKRLSMCSWFADSRWQRRELIAAAQLAGEFGATQKRHEPYGRRGSRQSR